MTEARDPVLRFLMFTKFSSSVLPGQQDFSCHAGPAQVSTANRLRGVILEPETFI